MHVQSCWMLCAQAGAAVVILPGIGCACKYVLWSCCNSALCYTCRYELPDEGLKGRLELKIFDNVGKGVSGCTSYMLGMLERLDG